MVNRSEVLARLQELGHAPKKSLGQNFLIDPAVTQKILRAVEASACRRWIEIGPGLGVLTEPMQAQGLPTTLIELDDGFADFWEQKGFQVVRGDALRVDWPPGDHWGLVSNLPYQIASRLIIDLSLERRGVDEMILMMQKEVAERVQALSNTADYGFLSLMAQSYWRISRVADAGPASFYPPPKVASRVLSFRKKSGPQPAKLWMQLLKAAFSQPRKMLKNNLRSIGGEGWLDKANLSGRERPAELDQEMYEHLLQVWVDHGHKTHR